MDSFAIMQSLPYELAVGLAATMHWIDGYTKGQYRAGILHRVPFFQALPVRHQMAHLPRSPPVLNSDNFCVAIEADAAWVSNCRTCV